MPATVQKRSPRISERNIFVKSSMAKPKKIAKIKEKV